MNPPLKHHLSHGVFINVAGMGVLLIGKSGIGKSELALGLISRGHRLIADDSVKFQLRNEQLIGTCPHLLQDFLEVRGLGILNIKAMFGEDAIIAQSSLELIINLKEVSKEELYKFDRLHGEHSEQTLLNKQFTEVCIPVAPGRNLAILVESAVRNHVLQHNGYYAVEDFTNRHNEHMKKIRND